ncbi:YcjX family protein [Gellertiella hungarica]|nr:YcjX family protein [Gellertiella hungarica]
MASGITSFADEALIAFDHLTGKAANLFNPTVRLGVTGLSRAGKTVFITSLVHNLLNGGRLPLFEPMRSGRIASVGLDAQPDDTVPRFQYEDHIRDLLQERIWPDSTRQISELRLTVKFQSASGWNRLLFPGQLSIDIVDYPGEWLLDLPLLGQDYRTFSRNTVELARSGSRAALSGEWLSLASAMVSTAPAGEPEIRRLSDAFARYLRACRDDERSLSTLPPGRFLMPGDLEGSPALTFAPLPDLPDRPAGRDTLHATMERRFEAYKANVVKPFFREHFARLDRQVVLVDALQAINRGPEAVEDLERALAEVLACFRLGRSGLITALTGSRIDRVLVAATKADHLHHEGHDRLEAITRRITERALSGVGLSGAGFDVMALASVRATREAYVERHGERLPVIAGTPMAGERIGGETFDGIRQTAIFPGDLPENPESLFQVDESRSGRHPVEVVRFRPPELDTTAGGLKLSVPHIRLDRALQYLLGDYLA